MRLLAGERHEMHAQESPLKMARHAYAAQIMLSRDWMRNSKNDGGRRRRSRWQAATSW
jgi:hypothetical protein